MHKHTMHLISNTSLPIIILFLSLLISPEPSSSSSSFTSFSSASFSSTSTLPICGEIYFDAEKEIDPILSGTVEYVEKFSSRKCNCFLRKNLNQSYSNLNLNQSKALLLSVNQNDVPFCAAYIGHDNVISSIQYPGCALIYNPILSQNLINLVNVIVAPGRNSLLKSSSGYGDLFTFHISDLNLRLIDVEDLGNFFSKDAPVGKFFNLMNSTIQEVKEHNLHILFEGYQNPKITHQSFQDLDQLTGLFLEKRCLTTPQNTNEAPLNQDFFLSQTTSSSAPTTSLTHWKIKITSPNLLSLRLETPCVVIDDIILSQKDKINFEQISFSFSNVGRFFVNRANSSASKAVNFESVFAKAAPTESSLLFKILFSSWADWEAISQLPSDFFSLPDSNWASFTVAYADVSGTNQSCLLHKQLAPPWLLGVPIKAGIIEMHHVIVNDAMVNQWTGQLVEDEKFAASGRTISLLDVYWNVTSDGVFGIGLTKLNVSAVSLEETVDLLSSSSLCDDGGERVDKDVQMRQKKLWSSLAKTKGLDFSKVNSKIAGTLEDIVFMVSCALVNPQMNLFMFEDMSAVTHFSVSRCHFEHASFYRIQFEKMRTLALYDLDLNYPYLNLFPCVMKNLSFEECCGNQTRFSSLQEIIIWNVPALRVSKLTKTMLCNSPELGLLSLRNSNISFIDPDILSVVPGLRVLDVSHNRLQSISTSFVVNRTSTHHFIYPDLILDFSHNNLTALPNHMFVNSTVTFLNVSHNQIKEFDFERVWDANCILTNGLDISHNSVREFSMDFSGGLMSRVQVLINRFFVGYVVNACHNQIEKVSVGSRSDVNFGYYNERPRGVVFDFSHNQLRRFDDISITNLSSIFEVNFSNNKLEYATGSSRSRSFMKQCCLRHGCHVDLSYNALTYPYANISALFLNTAVHSIDLSSNGLREFPPLLTDWQFIVPEEPLSSRWDWTVEERKYFYVSIKLSGNHMKNIDTPFCGKSMNQEEMKIFYDLSNSSVSYISERAITCKQFGAGSVFMLNLNRNPISCFPVPLDSSHPLSPISLLSVMDTNITQFPCDMNEHMFYLKSLSVGPSENAQSQWRSSTRPLDCCALRQFSYSSSVAVSINPDDIHVKGASNLVKLIDMYIGSKGFPRTTRCVFTDNSKRSVLTTVYDFYSSANKVQPDSSTCVTGSRRSGKYSWCTRDKCLPSGYAYGFDSKASYRVFALVSSILLTIYMVGLVIIFSCFSSLKKGGSDSLNGLPPAARDSLFMQQQMHTKRSTALSQSQGSKEDNSYSNFYAFGEAGARAGDENHLYLKFPVTTRYSQTWSDYTNLHRLPDVIYSDSDCNNS